MFSVLSLPQRVKNTKISHRWHHGVCQIFDKTLTHSTLFCLKDLTQIQTVRDDPDVFCSRTTSLNTQMFCFSLALSQNLITFTRCLLKTIRFHHMVLFCSASAQIETDAYMRSQSFDFENTNPTHDRLSLTMPNHSFNVLCFASFSDTGTESSKFGLCYSLELFKYGTLLTYMWIRCL